MFKSARSSPAIRDFLVFEGISVDDEGKQHYNDVTIAYRRACLNAIKYLKKFGYSGEQVYTILSTAPVEGRVSGVVDIPNACVSVAMPTEMFEFDIQPNARGPREAGELLKGRPGARLLNEATRTERAWALRPGARKPTRKPHAAL